MPEDARPGPPALSAEERRRNEMFGVAWILADIVMVIITSVLAKMAGFTFPAVQIAFIRGLIGVVLMLPLAGEMWRSRRRIGRPMMHVVRSVTGVVSLVSNFTSLAALPLGVHMAATFTRPLVVLGLAALLLKEEIRGRTWAAAIIGFAGVVVAVWPKLTGGDAASLLGLVAAALNVVFGAFAVIAIRLLSNEPRSIVVAGYNVGMVVLLGPFAMGSWQPVAAADWPILVGIGLASQAGMFFFVSGQRLASAATLAPLAYLQLVLAPVAGWFVFSERPTVWLVAGGAIIILAGLWNTLRR